MMKKYVTYGIQVNDVSDIVINLDTKFNMKPAKAFWGSPIDAEYGWKEYCISEDWFPKKQNCSSLEEYFKIKTIWTLKDDTKVFTVSNYDDILDLKLLGIITDEYVMDYKRAYEIGFHAIELTDPTIGHTFADELEMLFNAWDCESIVVLDKSKIVLL